MLKRPIDSRTTAYLSAVVAALRDVIGERLHAVYAGGSVALLDYDSRDSDLDVVVVVDDDIDEAGCREIGRRLDHARVPCPAQGLDLVCYRSATVAKPPESPGTVFALETGATWTFNLTGPTMSAELLLDLAICRQSGVPLVGEDPKQVVGPIPHRWLIPVAAGVVTWHREKIHHPFHDPTGACAVLNACRAWRLVSEGVLGSKTAGGEWVLDMVEDRLVVSEALAVVSEALAVRRGDHPGRLARPTVLAFLDLVARRIAEGCAPPAGNRP